MSCKEKTSITPKQHVVIDSISKPEEKLAVIEEPERIYSLDTLLNLLARVEKMSLNGYVVEYNHVIDSIFNQPRSLKIPLTLDDKLKLKRAENTNFIPISNGKRLFPFTNMYDKGFSFHDSLYINVIPLNESNNGDKISLISFGTYMGDWETDLYFICNDTIVAWQHNYHRYGLDLDSFQDEQNRTILYYTECLSSGAGVFENYYLFYLLDAKGLHPLKYTMATGSFNAVYWVPRMFYLDTKLINTSPLRIKYITTDELAPIYDEDPFTIKDSFVVTYSWTPDKLGLLGKFPSRFPEALLTNYSPGTDNLLYIKQHAATIRAALTGSDTSLQRTYTYMLSRLRDYDPDLFK